MCVGWDVLLSTLNVFLPLGMEVLLILSPPDFPLCVHVAQLAAQLAAHRPCLVPALRRLLS